jgi:nucleoside-diphosphate-sugar epimerase
MNKNIILTGESGFIGRNLIDCLVKNNYNIFSIVRNIDEDYIKSQSIKRIEYSISLENNLENNLFANSDLLIHLAWGDVGDVKSDSHLYFSQFAHFDFIKKIILSGVKTIFVLGSCFEYGKCSGQIKETNELMPHTPYGKSKVNLFNMLLELQKEIDFKLIWGRLFYIYGTGQKNTIYSQLMEHINLNKEIFQMSMGTQKLDYLHITDLLDLILKLLKVNSNVGAVNLCSGKPIELWKLVSSWISISNIKIKVERGVMKSRDYEPESFWGDRTYLDAIIQNLVENDEFKK